MPGVGAGAGGTAACAVRVRAVRGARTGVSAGFGFTALASAGLAFAFEVGLAAGFTTGAGLGAAGVLSTGAALALAAGAAAATRGAGGAASCDSFGVRTTGAVERVDFFELTSVCPSMRFTKLRIFLIVAPRGNACATEGSKTGGDTESGPDAVAGRPSRRLERVPLPPGRGHVAGRPRADHLGFGGRLGGRDHGASRRFFFLASVFELPFDLGHPLAGGVGGVPGTRFFRAVLLRVTRQGLEPVLEFLQAGLDLLELLRPSASGRFLRALASAGR